MCVARVFDSVWLALVALQVAIAAYRRRVAPQMSCVKGRKRRKTCLSPTVNASKVYLSVGVVESGDAPAYWQNRQYQVGDRVF